MAITKTWLTTSRNPRDTHGKIAGDTVGISEEFGNGLMYPGDGNQGPEEVANCKCVMIIGGKVSRNKPADRALDEALNFGELRQGRQIGTGVNDTYWGTADDVDVVIKDLSTKPQEMLAEIFSQDMNDAFGFGLKMPRVAIRGKTLVSERVQGETAFDIFKSKRFTTHDEAETWLAETFTVEERQSISFFDEILANYDRHAGNYMLGGDGELIAIDHGLTMVKNYSSDIYKSLTDAEQALTSAQRSILQSILDSKDEVTALWERRVAELRLEYIGQRLDQGRVTLLKNQLQKLFDRVESTLSDGYI